MFHKSKVFKNPKATNRHFSMPSSNVNQPLPTLARRSPVFEPATGSVPPLASTNVGKSASSPRRHWESRREEPVDISPSVDTSNVGVSESPPFRRRSTRHKNTISAVHPVGPACVGETVSSLSRGSPMLEAPTCGVPPVADTTPDQLVPPHLDFITSEQIPNKIDPSMSAIKDSLASLKGAATLAERIPLIPPLAGVLLQALTMRNESTVHQEKWDAVNEKLGKVASLVSDVGTACEDNNLEEDDLPPSLYTVFQTLESELGPIEHTIKLSGKVGAIRSVFLGTYLRRKVKAYDAGLSDVLQSFQATLAFDPHFVRSAERIEVEVTNVDARYDENQTPLHVASQLGHIQVMHSLIDRGANLNAENEDNETPLFLVSRNGNEDAAQLLLRCHAEVDHQDREKRTPLHRASENGHYLVARLLLKFRANSNARNAYDWTPLHLASRTGKRIVARVLLEWGADINAQNDLGWTPLHIASQKGHLAVVELLLANQAMVNAQEARGETALHLAAYYGYLAVAELLINHGANVRMQNKERETPLDLARREGHEVVARLLEARG